ncbi:MAG TPA: hypothetical protein VL172_18440 [Kofleriaceae bacterium]|nr:hypothetical protein [Kofleriaceae bacterium]
MRLLAALLTLLAAGPARADELQEDLVAPRGIGRAGAVTVSEDGGAALLLDPGALARRGGRRLQLAVAVHDRDARFRASDAPDSPAIADRGPAATFPLLAFAAELGPIIAAAAYLETGDLERALPAPAFDQPGADVLRLYPHRYAGTALGFHRRTLAAGAAVRATSWLGLGAAVTASDVSLSETRTAWGGFSGRLEELGDPEYDLELHLTGADHFVPGASAGALIAPAELPLEMALSVQWSTAAALSGDAEIRSTRSTQGDNQGPGTGTTSLASPLTARAGLRYLGDRILAEAGGELTFYPGEPDQRDWTLTGVAVVDRQNIPYHPASAPSLIAQRDHAAVRAAVDVEVARGFLWLTAGYAYRTPACPRARLSPVAGDLGGHTLAAGAEGQLDQITFTIGYARTWAAAVIPETTDVWIVDPFGGDTGPSALGRHDRAVDSFGAALEVAWE